jgi:hypothetical protein
LGPDAVIKVEVRDVGTDQDQVTVCIGCYMVPYMAGTAGPLNIDQFVFRVEMPEEQVVEFRVMQQPERTTGIGRYGF